MTFINLTIGQRASSGNWVEIGGEGTGESAGPPEGPPGVGAHTVDQVSPNTATQWDPTTSISVIGSGYVQGCVVQVDGVNITTHFIASDELVAYIPGGGNSGSPLQTSGTKTVRVVQNNLQSATNKPLTVSAWDYLTDLSSNIIMRHTSEAGVTTSGSSVTSWADQSGNSRTFTGVSGAEPSYLTSSGPGGKPCIRFDGVNDRMTSTSFSLSQPYVVAMVCRIRTGTTVNGRLQDGGVGNINTSTINSYTAENKLSIYAGGAGFSKTNDYWSLDTYHGFFALFDVANSYVRSFDAETIISAVGSGGITSGFQLGGVSGFSLFAKYDLCERIVLQTVPSQANLNRLEEQLRAYWSLPVVNTYAVMCEGDSLTFGANGGGTTYPGVADGYVSNAFYGIFGNDGVSGSTFKADRNPSANLAARKDTVKQFKVGKQRILCLWCGTNDVLFGADENEVYDNMRDYCLEMAAIGYKIIVAPIIDREWNSDGAGTAAEKRARANAFNVLLAAGWQDFADGYADLIADSRLGPDGARNDTAVFAGDKVHLIANGYTIVGSIFAPVIEAVAATF